MKEKEWPEVFICPICGKSDGGTTTIRQSWCDAGGFGPIPPEAVVHVLCDKLEQMKLNRGAIQSPFIKREKVT